jgi:flagellar protein FliO/FliZ
MQTQSNIGRVSRAGSSARLPCGGLLLAALLISLQALAAAPAHGSFAAPAQFSGGSTGFGMLRVCVALALVLASVYGVAWLMRRLRGAAGASAPGIAIVSQVSLGARERAVLLRVGEQHLLVGVAAGSVRLLQAVDFAGPPEGARPTATAPAAVPPTFRELLRRSLGR